MGDGLRYDPLPVGIRCLKRCSGNEGPNSKLYKGWILIITFLVYMSYHMNRKCTSVVKSTLNGNSSSSEVDDGGWAPFNQDNGVQLLGYLDTAFLLSYALAIFVCGSIADHVSLRYFLTFGMIGTAIVTALYGMADFWKIHSLAYFVLMQIVIGMFQATGWPAVVAIVGNWVSKGSRGLIMGIWNSHTSVGNILGNVVAGAEANSLKTWGLSYIFPALVIGGLGVVVFLYLPTTPQSVGLPAPNQANFDEDEERLIKSLQNQSDDEDDDENRDPNTIPGISFVKALFLPGVLEFSFCLFFAKLVCYTFMFCLPSYVSSIKIGGTQYGSEKSADIAVFYDIGGLFGSILCGLLADKTNCNGIICVLFQLISIPLLYVYYAYGGITMTAQLCVMFILGFFSNGPYALITTAVSADLGTQECIRGNAQALATVSAIIDGTGSIGATIGPYLTSVLINGKGNKYKLYGHVFYMLMGSSLVAALCLIRVFLRELRSLRQRRVRRVTLEASIGSNRSIQYGRSRD